MVTNCDHLTRLKLSPVLPWAFTEHGSIMAASVLNSQRAVEMSVFVVRAFVRLRDLARTHAELARHLAALERRVTVHDADLKESLRLFVGSSSPPSPVPRRQIGFARKSEIRDTSADPEGRGYARGGVGVALEELPERAFRASEVGSMGRLLELRGFLTIVVP